MEYEIEDRPQLGEDDGYEYLVTRNEWRRGVAVYRDHSDQAVPIPEQEAGS